MIFYQISQPEDLEPGYFGIREPKTSLPVADGEDGLMIMPESPSTISAPPGRIRRRLL